VRNPANGAWSVAENLRSYPPATSDTSLSAVYVGANNVQITFGTATGFSTMRFDGSWSTESAIHTYRAVAGAQYGTYLFGMDSGRALFVVDDAHQPQANWTDASGNWGATLNMPTSDLHGGSGRVDVASAPDGSALAVWLQWELQYPAVYAAYRPSGGTWQAPRRLTATGDHAFVARVHDAGGGRYAAVWKARRGSSNVSQMYAATFEVASQTWSTTVAGGDAAFDDEFGSAADNAGRVLASWYRPQTGSPSVYAAVFDAASLTWGTTTAVNNVSATAFEIAVGSDQANRFMVVWSETGTTPGKVRARGLNAGVWDIGIAEVDNASLLPTNETWTPTVASAAPGEYMTCWYGRIDTGGSSNTDYETAQVRCALYTGGVWSAATAVDQLPNHQLSFYTAYGEPDIVVDNGGYVLAWRACESSKPVRWETARFTGAPRSWQTPVEIHASTSLNLCEDGENAGPTLRRDGNGNLLVVWSMHVGVSYTSAYAAYYSAADAQWTRGHIFESGAGETGSARAAGRVGGGFDLLWVQDDGTRFALNASATQ
jgi:hypothetical protein